MTAERQHRPAITHDAVQRALAAFLEQGGLIHRLPEEHAPPRGMAEAYQVFENPLAGARAHQTEQPETVRA